MANKKIPASNGYFNQDMIKILKKGETKTADKKSTAKKSKKKK